MAARYSQLLPAIGQVAKVASKDEMSVFKADKEIKTQIHRLASESTEKDREEREREKERRP